MSAEFDLVTAPWLPCRDLAGRDTELGLRDTLVGAHDLSAVADASPLVTGALLRLLLAVLHDVLKGPAHEGERAELSAAKRFDPQAVEGYFDAHRARFDLFSAGRPFYQDKDFELPEPDSIARLAPERSSGNNVALFDHSVDAEPPAVSPAVAARWLVAHQTYGLGGGQGPQSSRGKHAYASHAPAAMGVNLFLQGGTLFETLVLNLVPHDVEEVWGFRPAVSRPRWQLDQPVELAPRVPESYLEYLTWPHRCVKLVTELDGGATVVRRVHTAQGTVAKDTVRDPFFAYRWNEVRRQSLPLRLTAQKALWRDSGAIFGFGSTAEEEAEGRLRPRPLVFALAASLLEELDERPAPACLAVGLDFNQSRIDLWRQEALPLSRELLLDSDAVDALGAAVRAAESVGQSLRRALRGMAQRLIRPLDPFSADRLEVSRLVAGWGGDGGYWQRLDRPFRDLVPRLADDRDTALRRWRGQLKGAADAAFAEAAERACSGDRAWFARVEARARFDDWWDPRRPRAAATPAEEEVKDGS